MRLSAHLGPFDAKRIHLQRPDQPRKALVELAQRIVQLVEFIHVGSERGCFVAEFREGRLEKVEARGRGVCAVLRAVEGGEGSRGDPTQRMRRCHGGGERRLIGVVERWIRVG